MGEVDDDETEHGPLAHVILLAITAHYKASEVPRRAAVLEVLSALGSVAAHVLASTTYDPDAFEFFRRVIADQLAELSITDAQEDAIEARAQGRKLAPPWLDYRRAAHVLLDAPEFRGLVDGREIIATDTVSGEIVHIMLRDIGFPAMFGAISEAAAK